MNVETASIDDVHLDPANTRTHPERNKASIRASLNRFRAGRSIVLDANNVVRAGNGTVEEARQAGFDEVLIVEPGPNQLVAVKRADWTASEATAYGIADNRIAGMAEDDDAALATTLRALQSEDFDLAAVGYSDDELQGLIDGLAVEALANGTPAEDPGPQIDRADELQKKWQTATGQFWVIPSKTTPGGEHRLLCGDSTKAEDVARVMGGEKADACITDPPYNVGFGYEGEYKGQDAKTPEEYGRWLNGALGLAEKYVDAGGPFFVWQAQRNVAFFSDWFNGREWRLFAACKNFIQVRPTWLQYAWDPVICWTNGKTDVRNHAGIRDWHVAETSNTQPTPDRVVSGVHPCPRPLDTVSFVLEGHTEFGNLVFDPFSGSGTTIVAAEQTGRLARGIEIAPRYIAVSLERLEGLGLSPALSTESSA